MKNDCMEKTPFSSPAKYLFFQNFSLCGLAKLETPLLLKQLISVFVKTCARVNSYQAAWVKVNYLVKNSCGKDLFRYSTCIKAFLHLF